MDVHEDPVISKAEKVTRFGCGAALGIVYGFFLVIKFALSSYGVAAAIVVGSVCVCGYLALMYGDEFWYGIFGGGA